MLTHIAANLAAANQCSADYTSKLSSATSQVAAAASQAQTCCKRASLSIHSLSTHMPAGTVCCLQCVHLLTYPGPIGLYHLFWRLRGESCVVKTYMGGDSTSSSNSANRNSALRFQKPVAGHSRHSRRSPRLQRLVTTGLTGDSGLSDEQYLREGFNQHMHLATAAQPQRPAWLGDGTSIDWANLQVSNPLMCSLRNTCNPSLLHEDDTSSVPSKAATMLL